MTLNSKKFLDSAGLTYFAQLLNNYPDNEVLASVIDAIGDALDEKADLDLATNESPGLMSAADKAYLETLDPNMRVVLDNMAVSQLYITNAKPENLLGCVCRLGPIIESQVRTTNLLNVNAETWQNAYINSSGTVTASTNDYLGPFIEVTPGQDIYYKGVVGPTSSSSINRRLHVYNANQQWIKQLSYQGSLRQGSSWSTHGTIPSNGAYVRVSWGIADTNVQISVGNVAYQPYYLTPFDQISSVNIYCGETNVAANSDLYTINIPNGIYCLELNPITGIATSIAGHISSYNGETLPGIWWSDRDTYAEGTSPTTGAEVVYMLDSSNYIDNNVTPVTIPLNQGVNYFWAENGLITEFDYYAKTLHVNHITVADGIVLGEDSSIVEQDIINWNNAVNLAALVPNKANIDSPQFIGSPTAPTVSTSANNTRLATTEFVQTKMNSLATNETSMKASKNYSEGDYVCIYGTFYKVIAAVAQNTNFVVNTNVQQTTVGEQLQLLMDAVFNS